MPKVSFAIPAYNVADFVARCIRSLKSQSFEDFEAVIVEDASTDDTAAIISREIAGDDRFVLIRHEQNRGRHIARRDAVLATTGDYVLCLDSDDELAPDSLGELVALADNACADSIHYGIAVIGENGLPESERAAFESFVNKRSRLLEGDDVLRSAFIEGDGQTMDWRITQRLIRGTLARQAFQDMTDQHLERSEDAYECLVLLDHVKSSYPAEDCRAYVYHYGVGVTGASPLSVDSYRWACQSTAACISAMRDYAPQCRHPRVYDSCVEGAKHKLLELISNDWLNRLADDDKEAAAQALADSFGAAEAGRELYRFVRDRAYEYVTKGTVPQNDGELDFLCRVAQGLHVDEGLIDEDLRRYLDMRRVANTHMADLRRAQKFSAFDQEDVRIFVTTHKRVNVPNASCIQPVQVGPSNKTDRFADTYHDCDGQNIADLNPMYCELTTQYWAWKNVRADYYGFCHYRRYFNFSEREFEENPFGEIMDGYIDEANLRKYGLDNKTIKSCVEGYDFITTGFHDLRDFPGDYTTPREQYDEAPKLHVEDLDRMAQIVKRLYPDYAKDVDGFLNGHEACFCNMFIMRRELFFDYCEWLFPILDAFVKETDMTLYSKEALRTPGHLAERLLNIYYLHGIRVGAGWKTKQLQCVHFERPDATPRLKPYVEVRGADALPGRVVPVVFAADNNYVPMLATTITSMVENADPQRPLDIVVFERNISYLNKKTLVDSIASHPNALLRFYDVSPLIADYDLSTNNEHISLETYYRFLVQEVMGKYDKVLYLDSDLVVLDDVCKLYDTDLGDKLLAATRDVDYLGNLNMPDGIRMKYTRETLKMANPYDYFQAGVLVLNVAQMRRLHTVQEWLNIASQGGYIYDDQDILNAECEGRVTYLPADWNVTHGCFNRVTNVYSFAPVREFDAYNDSRNHPRIIHYAGAQKPWDDAKCDFAPFYWRYARKTPFYEALLQRLTAPVAPAPAPVPVHEKAVPEDSPLRRYIDPIAPLGSARREVLKSIGRAVQGKK